MSTISEMSRVVVLEEPQVPTKPAEHILPSSQMLFERKLDLFGLPNKDGRFDLERYPDAGFVLMGQLEPDFNLHLDTALKGLK